MTDKTATQNLTRTTATDDPKQVAAYLRTLAMEADQRMRSHFYDLGRSQRRPFAAVRVSTPFDYDYTVSNNIINYDTVEEDTAGLVDLSASPQVITLTETGFWAVGGYLETTGFGLANADVWMELSGGFYNVVRDGDADFLPVSVFGIRSVTVPNTSLISQILNSGSSSTSITTVRAARMWAYKVRDL